jgi:hypothetical protein
MRLAPKARIRVLRLARHAAVAAGLGVGWLLLGGSPASASQDASPPVPVSSQVLSPTVIAEPVAASPVRTVSAAAEAAMAALPSAVRARGAVLPLQNTAGPATAATIKAVGPAVAAAPAAVSPVLQGPLKPVAPVVTVVTVVTDTASRLAQTAADAGRALTATAATPLGVPLAGPLSPSAPAGGPEQAAGPVVNRADASAAPGAASGADAGQRARTEASAPQDPPAWAAGGRCRASVTVRTLGWSTLQPEAGVAGQGLGGGIPAPLGPPPLPGMPPATPPGAGAGGTGGPVAPAGGTATLAAGFLLAPAFLLLRRARPPRSLMPTLPAFDPGSTPD